MNIKINEIEKFKGELRNLIRQEMDKRGLSLSDLAKILEMNRSHVSDIINSDRGSLEKLLMVSKPILKFELNSVAIKEENSKDHQD